MRFVGGCKLCILAIFLSASAWANGHIETFNIPQPLTLNFVSRQALGPTEKIDTLNVLVDTYIHRVSMVNHQATGDIDDVWQFHTQTLKPSGELLLEQDLYRRIDAKGWTEYYYDDVLKTWKEYLLIPLPIKGGSKWNASLRLSMQSFDPTMSSLYRQRQGETLYWEEVKVAGIPLWCFKLLVTETTFNPQTDDKPVKITHRYWFHKQLGVVRHEAEYDDHRVEITELSDIPTGLVKQVQTSLKAR